MVTQVIQSSSESLGKALPNAAASQHAAEVSVKSVALNQAAQQLLEASARGIALNRLSNVHTEALLGLDAPAASTQFNAESLSAGIADAVTGQLAYEVIWQEKPSRELCPFTHNWVKPVVERLAWLTDVKERRDGTEHRLNLRFLARRTLTLNITVGESVDLLGLVDFLKRNQGKRILWPLPQFGLKVSDLASGDAEINFNASWPVTDLIRVSAASLVSSAKLEFDNYDNFLAENTFPTGEFLIKSGDGWEYTRGEYAGVFWNKINLENNYFVSRDYANACIYPLAVGVLAQSYNANQLTDSVADVTLDITLSPQLVKHAHNLPLHPDGPPIFAQNNWDEDVKLDFEPLLEKFDNASGQDWQRRFNANPQLSFSRRLLVKGHANIQALLGTLDYLQGRYRPIYLAEKIGINGLNSLNVFAGQKSLTLNTSRYHQQIDAYGELHLTYSTGQTQIVGYAGFEKTPTGVQLNLVEPIAEDGYLVQICRLIYARGNQDEVDLIWHTNDLVECNLSFKQLVAAKKDLISKQFIPTSELFP